MNEPVTFVVGVSSFTSVQGSSKRMLDMVLMPCRNRKTPCVVEFSMFELKYALCFEYTVKLIVYIKSPS